jgi:hypothetical protein
MLEVGGYSRLTLVMAAARHLIRAVKVLARDGRIPRPLRGLALFGLPPIPGPIDETVLLIVGVILLAFYRAPLTQAWRDTEDSQ